MVSKYVVIDNPNLEEGNEKKYSVVIFSESIHHSSMHEMIRRDDLTGAGSGGNFYRKPVSAGFLIKLKGELICYGRSETLDLESNPERDLPLIKKLLEIK